MARIFDVNLHAAVQLAGMLVEGRFEPTFTQHAALQPLRCEGAHLATARQRP